MISQPPASSDGHKTEVLEAMNTPRVLSTPSTPITLNPGSPESSATAVYHKDIPTPPPTSTTTATKSRWRHLFVFANRQHTSTLVSATAAAVIAAGAKTFYAIILGKIFDLVSGFGAGSLSGAKAMSGVSTWCIVLTAMGVAIWIAESAFLALWIIFGELMAKSVRDNLFGALLKKEMAWFDAQVDGMGSLLGRMQT